MSEDMYWIEGDVQIPEEKRDLVNQTVLRVLQICGVRKREKMMLSGKEVEVAALPRPNGEGLVEFDYFLFDEGNWEPCVYDTASCHLQAHNFGAWEFSLPIGLILALEATYSSESCRFMTRNGDGMPCYWVSTIRRLLPDEKILPNEKAAHELAELYRRKNEDEFLEYWDGGDFNLSSSLRRDLRDWIRDFDSCSPVEPEEVEKLLSEILSDMVRGWCCRLGEKAFAEEFLAHQEDRNYRRALGMVRSFMYSDMEYFPELTHGQALKWMIRNYRGKNETAAVRALQSLLLNHRMRMKLFGF